MEKRNLKTKRRDQLFGDNDLQFPCSGWIREQMGCKNNAITTLTIDGLKDKLCYGLDMNSLDPVIVDPVKNPGALYVGGMGSGKSISARFTLLTRLLSNSEHDIYILVDPLKGMVDYSCMFPLEKNVVKSVGSGEKILSIIDMLHAELMQRRAAFSRVCAPNIYEFETIVKKTDANYKLARIFLCIEEFHVVPGLLGFKELEDIPGTAANRLKEIVRVGRSYGINLIAMSQRCTQEDFPSTLKPGISKFMAFRVNNPGDAAAANLPQAADILMEQRGRCVYEGGQIQFPYLSEESANILIKKHYKPLNAELLVYSVSDYRLRL